MRTNRFSFLVLGMLLSLIGSSESRADRKIADVTTSPAGYVGRLVTSTGEVCTASLAGPKQIVAAAHCIKYGIKGAKFYLRLKDNKSTAVSDVTGVFLSGGGINDEDMARGTDWLVAELSQPLGHTYGWMEMSNKPVEAGQKVSLIAYGKDYEKGVTPGMETCVVKEPIKAAEKYCQKNKKGELSCNFFFHECEVDEKGFGSGGPMVVYNSDSGKHEIIGIQTGFAKMATKVFNTAGTVNESSIPAANVIFHNLNMRNFVAAEMTSKDMVGRRFTATAPNKMVDEVKSLLAEWSQTRARFTVAERFERIQYWNSVTAQKTAMKLFTDLRTAVRENPQVANLKIGTETLPDDCHDKDGDKFAQYYDGKKTAATEFAFLDAPKEKKDDLKADLRGTMVKLMEVQQDIQTRILRGENTPELRERITKFNEAVVLFNQLVASEQPRYLVLVPPQVQYTVVPAQTVFVPAAPLVPVMPGRPGVVFPRRP